MIAGNRGVKKIKKAENFAENQNILDALIRKYLAKKKGKY
jgi:hypothetical protein